MSAAPAPTCQRLAGPFDLCWFIVVALEVGNISAFVHAPRWWWARITALLVFPRSMIALENAASRSLSPSQRYVKANAATSSLVPSKGLVHVVAVGKHFVLLQRQVPLRCT